jgi:hypothetical protein
MQSKHMGSLYILWTQWSNYNNYILLYVFRTFISTTHFYLIDLNMCISQFIVMKNDWNYKS